MAPEQTVRPGRSERHAYARVEITTDHSEDAAAFTGPGQAVRWQRVQQIVHADVEAELFIRTDADLDVVRDL